jgi:hypothetical protein
MSERRIAPAGDGFYAVKVRELEELEERYRHELMPDGERQELRDEIERLRGGR